MYPSLDTNKDDWTNAIKKDNLPWQHLSDLKGKNNIAALIYAVNSIPDNILIDKNGIIIARGLRKAEKLNTLLTDILAVPAIQITDTANNPEIKLKSAMIWQDENGKELNQQEVDALLKNNKYSPHIDTEKNIITLKKT